MGQQLARVTAAAVEVVDPAGLAARAAEVAACQRSPETRRTYAAVYRSFGAFLGPDATREDLTPEAVRAYRDALERAGRSSATVAKHLSALRGLADALGVEAQQLRTVRSARVGRGDPRALTHDEWQRLLRMPDRRTRQGKRDLALLHLLGSVGLRRAEAARLLVTDVDERRRASDPRLRQAVKGSTAWWAIVRYGKRGRTRAVPLDEDALDAIVSWVKSRPTAPTEHLLLSLPRTGRPGPLSTRDIARIVARHATAADLPDDRRSPHVLRHTFCTHLADAGADTAVIRELAGHAESAPPPSTPPSTPADSSTPSPNAPINAAAPDAPPPATERPARPGKQLRRPKFAKSANLTRG
jgi:site-specific recombinase XerD